MMKNHTNSTSGLELYRREIFEIFVPVICIMAILGIFGLAGNIITVIFYSRKCKTNTTTTLISFLAVMDTFLCILIIPIVVEMAVNVTNDQRVVCKIVHAFGVSFGGSSTFAVMLIAIDRHRNICFSFKTQLTQNFVKYAIIGTLIFSFGLGIRILFTVDTSVVDLKSDSGEIVLGTYCTASDHPKYKKISSIFTSVHFFIVTMVWITITTCYSLIIIRVVSLRKKRTRNEHLNAKQQKDGMLNDKQSQVLQNVAEFEGNCTDASCTCINTRDTVFKSSGIKDTVGLKSATQDIADSAHLEVNLNKSTLQLGIQVRQEPLAMTEPDETEDELGQQQTQPKKRSISKRTPKKTSGISPRELRLTFMMLTVSIVFILCFLPYFAVRIVARIVLNTGVEFELDPLKQIALKLPYLNSTFNPFIYLLFNRKFREFVWTPIRICISKC
ncbi:alpha-2C adrenergic receptor-like [Mya arenaria]|uniref:alpha-2C adrenergic receptor-like n=1 Tax=Mya arenaria TaxID=6604 RepID=UPI0022E34E61|nr:alpha-2C adrenergic receptor-like [Mya arenaria]